VRLPQNDNPRIWLSALAYNLLAISKNSSPHERMSVAMQLLGHLFIRPFVEPSPSAPDSGDLVPQACRDTPA
jgi:hypothetical protein